MAIDFKTYFSLSFLSMAALVAYAYYTKEQFYPTILFLVSSKISFVLSGNMVLVTIALVAKFLKTIFFGKLRSVEVELLFDKAKYSVTETCLALTVFRHEITPTILMIFGSLIVVKAFHWLAKSRMEYNEQIQPLAWIAHARMISLLVTLVIVDLTVARHCVEYTFENGRSVFILFGFEFGLLLINIFSIFFRYIIQCVDEALENGFLSKGFSLMLCDLIADALKFVTYACFFCLIFVYYGLPIHIIREVWMSFLHFQTKMASFIKYLQLNHNLDKRFDDASAEELTAAGDCLICREIMTTGKKLPCSHVFHLSCLRGWLQHQQSCPLCRSDIPTTVSRSRSRSDAIARAAQAEQRRQNAAVAPVAAQAAVNVGGGDTATGADGSGGSDRIGSAASASTAQTSVRDGSTSAVGESASAFVSTESTESSEKHPSFTEFPLFFKVKESIPAHVYPLPVDVVDPTRVLPAGVVVFATRRLITEDGLSWLQVVDGWVIESRPGGLTFDAETFLEPFLPSTEQLSTMKVASSSSKNKSISSIHRQFLPKNASILGIRTVELRKRSDKLCLRKKIQKDFRVTPTDSEQDPMLKKLALLENEIFSMSEQLVHVTENLMKTQELFSEIRQAYFQSEVERISGKGSFKDSIRNRDDTSVAALSEVVSCNEEKMKVSDSLNSQADLSQDCAGVDCSEAADSCDASNTEDRASPSVREIREKYFKSKLSTAASSDQHDAGKGSV